MRRYRKLILSHATFLYIEARETEHLLLKQAKVLIGKLAYEELLRKARITGIFVAVLHHCHTVIKLFLGDTQCLTELCRVNTVSGFIHHNHDVIRRLVKDHQFAITIADISTRGIFDFLQEGVRVCTLFIVITCHLQHEEPNNIDHYYKYSSAPYHITTV